MLRSRGHEKIHNAQDQTARPQHHCAKVVKNDHSEVTKRTPRACPIISMFCATAVQPTVRGLAPWINFALQRVRPKHVCQRNALNRSSSTQPFFGVPLCIMLLQTRTQFEHAYQHLVYKVCIGETRKVTCNAVFCASMQGNGISTIWICPSVTVTVRRFL